MKTNEVLTARQLLELLHPDGPYHIAAFSAATEKLRVFQTFDNAGAAEEFATSMTKANIYCQPAELVSDHRDKKSSKVDVAASRWVWSDVDIKNGVNKEQLDLLKHQIRSHVNACKLPTPTIVGDSGHGLWFLWRIPRTTDLELVESINRGIREAIGAEPSGLWRADNVHNCDRIARLLGTTNWPTKKKLAEGRIDEPLPTGVLEHNDLTHEPGDFPTQAADANRPQTDVEIDCSNVQRLTSVDDLDHWNVPDRIKVIIVQGMDPDDKDRHPSRSEWLFDAVCNLVRCGVDDTTIYSVITDPDFKISESVLEVSNPDRYACKQIKSAKEASAADFAMDKNGKPYATQDNIRLAIAKLGRQIAFDEFARREMLEGRYLDDATADALYLEIEKRFGFRTAKDYFSMVLTTVSRENAFHPVRDYLQSLEWDGQERLPGWLTRYLGTEDNEYTRTVGEIVLVAACRRVRQPGCKFDEMMVLESAQGTAKSTVLATLAVRDEWFSDDLPLGADTKRVIEALAGRWIVEAADLKGMKRADADNLKSFLSRRIDRSRMAYGRRVEEHPRQCVIVGTTNDERYLKDATGNRRFWPVRTGKIDLASLRRAVEQLWAEAASKEAQGMSIRLPERLWSVAGVEQAERKVINPMVEPLMRVLGDAVGKLDSDDAWSIVGKADPGRRTQRDMEVMGEAMRELGFERRRRRLNGQLTYCYLRGEEIDEGGLTPKLNWLQFETDPQSGRQVLQGENVPPDAENRGNSLPF